MSNPDTNIDTHNVIEFGKVKRMLSNKFNDSIILYPSVVKPGYVCKFHHTNDSEYKCHVEDMKMFGNGCSRCLFSDTNNFKLIQFYKVKCNIYLVIHTMNLLYVGPKHS